MAKLIELLQEEYPGPEDLHDAFRESVSSMGDTVAGTAHSALIGTLSSGSFAVRYHMPLVLAVGYISPDDKTD